MRKECEISTCISGSFKFKPEIDRLIDEFTDLGVSVLSPKKGWLPLPKHRILRPPQFRPLPSEKDMSIRMVEDSFLSNLVRSKFLYVADFEGYAGLSTCMEIGFALAKEIPIYSVEKIKNAEHDLWFEKQIQKIKVMVPSEVVEVWGKFEDSLV